MAFSWDERSARYRDRDTGRFLPASRIRAGVDQVADASAARMARISAELRDGALSVAGWEQEMRQAIKLNQMAEVMAAHGGRSAMTQSDYGWAGSQIRAQYRYLQQFAADIVSGEQPMNGRLIARAAMYGAAGRAAFEATKARDAATSEVPMEERNVLHAAESCAGCVGETARGWVPQGTLSLPGTRSCVASCRCSLSRRRVRARVLAEAG